MAEAVCIFRSFVEAIDELDEADQLAAYKAIVRYGLDGIVTDTTGPAKAVFLMAKPVIDKSLKKAEAGSKGGKQKAENMKQKAAEEEVDSSKPLANPSKTLADSINDVANGKQTLPNKHIGLEINDIDIPPSISPPLRRQIPPTVEMVRAYCEEKGYTFDPEAFVDHYESNGWMVGKTKMKDWQASCRTWAKSQYRDPRGSPKKVINIDQHDYDFDDIDRKLLALQIGAV